MPKVGSEPARRRAGGVQPNILTLDDIVDAGLTIIRRGGLDALTVRTVAEELGVTGPALYYHVSGGKEALIDLVVDRIITIHRADTAPRPGDSWIDRLERQVLAVAAVEHDYPGVMPYVMTAGRDQAMYIDSSEQALRILLDDAGFPPDDAARALAAITAHVVGWTSYQAPSPAAARACGHHDLEAAATHIADEDPGVTLRVGLRSLLEGLAVTRGRPG